MILLYGSIAPAPTLASTIYFEDLPLDNMYLDGGENIGTYYPGLNFGPSVTGIDLTDSTAFPPHSGSIAVWDPNDLTIAISFSDPQSMVGIWYTSLDFLTLDAFDSGNGLLSEAVGTPNTDGTTGESDFLSVSAANITSITLTGPPGGYVLDDLTFTPQETSSVPEPSSASLLLGAFVLGWAGYRWRSFKRKHRAPFS